MMPPVEVRRSTRRRRTVSAYRRDGVIVVMVPATLTAAEEAEWVRRMVERLERADHRRLQGDEALMARAADLNARYLEGRATPESVRWVDNMTRRWGSCTPSTRSIRLSRRLLQTPEWVIDYVVVHELAHLLEAHHNAAFWNLVDRYPRSQRAQGYLEAFATHGLGGSQV